MTYADLSSANFTGANLSGEATNLWKVVCNHGIFRGANLSNAKINEAFISQNTDFSGENTNLSGADLTATYLCGSVFYKTNLTGAKLQNANLSDDFGAVDLRDAILNDADMYQVNLSGADLSNAQLRKAFLGESNLSRANFTGADLTEAFLGKSNLVEATLTDATLNASYVYGTSVWKAELTNAKQKNLVITPEGEATITVDDLKVAQFVYLLLNNKSIRDVIDTVSRKAVLILGRFTTKRKEVLDDIKEKLRDEGYVPMLFDFDIPQETDIGETVTLLARMSKFIIADLSEPSSLPKELESIVKDIAVPVQPIIEENDRPYAMFSDYWKYHWVLKVYRYPDKTTLIESLKTNVIEPAETKENELRSQRIAAYS